MKLTKSIPYKDSTVYVSEGDADFSVRSKPPVCWCCMHNVKKGKIAMLINNYKYFPNMVMHEQCFNSISSNFEKAFESIEADYKEYKKLNIVFGP